MATFGTTARYDDEPWADHRSGRDGVRSYYTDLMHALPDLAIEVRHRHVASDSIVLEVIIRGTHLGQWRGLPATGRRVEFPLCAVYTFDAHDRLAGERIYYDRGVVLHQVGLFHEPLRGLGRLVTVLSHPVTIRVPICAALPALGPNLRRQAKPNEAFVRAELPPEIAALLGARTSCRRLLLGYWLKYRSAVADVTTMQLWGRFRAFLFLRCPNCRRGPLFNSWIRWIQMNDHCPCCGLTFYPESGYFVGSIYINYGGTVAVVSFSLVIFRTVPERFQLVFFSCLAALTSLALFQALSQPLDYNRFLD